MRYAQLTPGRGFRVLPALAHLIDRGLVSPRLRRCVDAAVARTVARSYPAVELAAPGAAADVDHLEDVGRLNERGLLRLGRVLGTSEIDDVTGFLEGMPRFDAADRRHALNPPGIDTAAIVGFPPWVVLECPHVIELAHDARLLAIVGRFLGCKPTIISWGLMWARPSSAVPGTTQRFHRDREGWRSVKLFVYLTDVGEDGGPHEYACGSHRTRSSMRCRTYSDDETVRRVGADRIETVTGPPGTGFLADTFGLHKGAPPAAHPRLILQIHYAMVPSPVYVYQPRRLTRLLPAIDPYINRLFVSADPPGDLGSVASGSGR